MWPLYLNILLPLPGIPPSLTASFGEYREFRVHKGVDFSTLRETGWPVVAIESGWVVQLQKAKTGYGNTIRILHPGGWNSFYAHLESFNEFLEYYWKSSSGKKYGTAFIPPFLVPVQKGDVIGKSGESGAGLPHLHLEISWGITFPLNPLLLLPKDEIPENPVTVQIESLTFVPLEDNSMVNASPYPMVFIPKKEKDGYVVDGAINLRGKVGVELEGFEEWKGSRRAFPRIQLVHLGERKSEVCFERDVRVSLPDNSSFYLEMYQPVFTHLSPTTFTYRLYDLKKAGVEQEGICSGGILNHVAHEKFRIIVWDWRGKEHRVEFSTKNPDGKREEVFKPRTIPVLHGGALEFWAYPENPIAVIDLNPEGTGRWDIEEGLEIIFSTCGRVKPVRLQVGKKELDARGIQGLRPVSPAYFFYPPGEACALEIRYKRQEKNPRESFFRWDGYSQRWRPVPSSFHSSFLTSFIPYFSIFAVWEDVQPPEISPPGKWKRRCCVVPIHDYGLGIEEKTLRIFWEEQEVEGEYDPDRGWWKSDLDLVLREGTLRIHACDKGGNCSEKAFVYPALP
ncbi:MAG: peptidoglycan DD-metalloendopeptidase family protein [bacterium JZ-2024 1]